MADTTIAEAISLLTKVSADTAKRLDALEAGGGSVAAKATKAPRQVVKKAEPVIVTDFGPKAEKDLGRLGGKGGDDKELKEEKNKNSNLLGLLGLAGAAALALKFLFDGEGFTGLIQGFQNAVAQVTKFATKAKGLVDDIGKKVGTFADDAAAGLKRIGAKATSFVDDIAKINIKSAMDDIGKAVSGATDNIINGFKNIVNKTPALSKAVEGISKGVSKVSSVAKAGKDAVTGTAKKVAEKGGGLFGKIGGAVKSGASFVASGAKKVAATAVKGAKMVAGFTKDQVMKPVSNAIKKIKPLKLLGGLAKSPLLAPIVESFFTAKDVNNLIDQFSAGEIDQKTLNQSVGKRLIEAVSGVIGGAGGAVLGSMLGSVFPGLGNIIGAIAGGVLGDVGGRAIGGLIAKAMGSKTGKVGEFALNSPLFKVPGQENVTEITDGIITKDGQVIKPDSEDTLYAMKDGGPLVDILLKGSNEQKHLLTKLTNMNEFLLKQQTEMLKQHTDLLSEIADKTGIGGTNIISNNSVTNMNSQRSLRDLQEVYS